MGILLKLGKPSVKLRDLLRRQIRVNPAELLAELLPNPLDERPLFFRRHRAHLLNQFRRAHGRNLRPTDWQASQNSPGPA